MTKNWFRKCDLLHIPMSLSYKNEYLYTTNIGSFLTILCFIIIVLLGSYEIKILADKSSFTIITNQYNDISQKIDFDHSHLLFQLIDNTGEILEINENLYEFQAYDMEWIVTKDVNGKNKYEVINTKLKMGKCDKILINATENFSQFNLSKYICIQSGQNITSYGLLGDMNNGFKGFRIYLNKCNGKNSCYNDSYIIDKLQNIKFRVTYLGFNTNIFNIGNHALNFQMTSKACSVSTHLLKKFYFTFSIGKFYLYNNIFYKQKEIYNYIIGNDPIMDIDLDPSSTIDKNRYTLAYFSFNFDGKIIEIRKEVKRIFDTISYIGNAFNIILTLFQIINNYYSNKVLFADIFKSIFFKDINININSVNQSNFRKSLISNKIKNNSKKNIMDLSDGLVLNNSNLHNNNFLKKSSNKAVMTLDKNKIKKISQVYTINDEKITNSKLMYFYLFPLWILKKHKSFNNVCLIKDKICSYFSVEKINELIKFKEIINHRKTKKSKINNTEFIKVNKKFQDSNDSIELQSKNLKY